MTSKSVAFPRGKKRKVEGKTDLENDPDLTKAKKKLESDDLFKSQGAETKKKKKKKSKKDKENEQEANFQGLVVSRADRLTYGDLGEGMTLLGTISHINDYDLKVSLPGHLVGHVAIANISRTYTKALKELTEGNEDDHVLTLKEMFHVGQPVICAVESLVEEEFFTKVNLSLSPEKVHGGLTMDQLARGVVLQAAVKSIEDHGFIMDIGVKGAKAFLPHKRVEKYVDSVLGGKAPGVGHILPTTITKNESGSVALNANPASSTKAVVENSKAMSIHSIIPGMRVRAKVEEAIHNGIKVKFGQLTAYVHDDHLAEEVSEEEEIIVQLLYTLPTVNTIYATCKQHLLFAKADKLVFAKEVGTKVKNAKVVSVMKSGLVLRFKDDPILGFVSAKQTADKKDKVANLPQKYPAGSSVICKVINYDYADAMYICSMQKSVLNQKITGIDQLKPGDKITAVLKKFLDTGAVVSLGPKVQDAFIPSVHLSDVPLKHPEKKYPVGSKMKCRVLHVDPTKNSIHLTHKSILVNEEYPVVHEYDSSQTGFVTEGVVVSVSDSGLLLKLFGNVKGWVPKTRMSTEPIEYPEKLFFVGQVLKCKLIHVDEENKRMTLSLIIGGTSKPLGSKEKKQADGIKMGEFYDCIVKEKAADGLAMEIEHNETMVKAFLPKNHLTDHLFLADALLETYAVDDKIRALCFERDVMPIMTLKPLITKMSESNVVSSFSDVNMDMYLPAVVNQVKSYGAFVRLPVWNMKKNALVPTRFLADGFIEKPQDVVSVHQTVMAKVIEKDEKDHKIAMSLKKCEQGVDVSHSLDILVSLFRDLDRLRKHTSYREGLPVTCKVSKVTGLGLEVEVDSKIKGIITNAIGLFGVKPKPTKNDVISAVVLFNDPEFQCLELSANPEMVKKATMAINKLPKEDSEITVRATVVLIKTELNFVTMCIKGGKYSGRFVHVPTRHHINDQEGYSDAFSPGEIYKIIVKEIDGDRLFGILDKHDRGSIDRKRKRKDSLTEAEKAKQIKRIRNDSLLSEVGDNEVKKEASVTAVVPEETKEDPGWQEDFNPWANTSTKDEDKDDEAGSPKKLKTHLSKKEKKVLDRLEAEEIAKAEQRVLDGEEAKPETADEFERLVLASPNSSLCWVQFMAFHAEKNELDKARDVAKKALEKISFREEDERLNVYMASFNLENTLGDETSTEGALQLALKYNDQFKVLKQAATMYEAVGKVEQAEKAYKTLIKKYRKEPEAWILLGMYYFKTNNFKEARFTLQRSVQADNLDSKHHVEVTSKFGQMEFKLGESERGKDVFEKLVDNFPGRTDLWSVYIDMLVKAKEIEAARAVLQRTILLNLQPKKMKFFFKKFLSFEEENGDKAKVDWVRKKALEYVEDKVTVEDE